MDSIEALKKHFNYPGNHSEWVLKNLEKIESEFIKMQCDLFQCKRFDSVKKFDIGVVTNILIMCASIIHHHVHGKRCEKINCPEKCRVDDISTMLKFPYIKAILRGDIEWTN